MQARHLSETCIEAHGDASGGPYRIAGKQSAKVDEVETVVEVLPVHLKAHGRFFGLINVHPRGRIYGQHGPGASASEVDAAYYQWTVLGQRICFGSLIFERQSRTVLRTRGEPETWQDLLLKTGPKRIALVLRVRDVAVLLRDGVGRVIAKEEASGHWKPDVANHVGIT
jgi:hypothetical protein